jgi:TonB family protein
MKSLLVLFLLFNFMEREPATPLCVVYLESPDYPEVPRQARVQGEIKVDVEIDREGYVISAKSRGGEKLLAREAERNVRTWRFGCLEKLSNTTIKHTVTYEFRLEGEPVPYQPRPRVSFYLPTSVRIVTQPMKIT